MTSGLDVDRAGPAAIAILRVGARALARDDDPGAGLTPLLEAIAEASTAASAVIMTRDPSEDRLTIAASVGLAPSTAVGLEAAVRDHPAHPIARTFADGLATFDVAPTAPGGPALRSHLPLVVTRDGTDRVVGVLALAHDRPIDAALRPVLGSAAELAAVAVVR